EPATAGPTTQEPATAGPTTQEPATAGPTTQEPATAGPTTQEPTATGQTTDGPTAGGLRAGGEADEWPTEAVTDVRPEAVEDRAADEGAPQRRIDRPPADEERPRG
ncbi:chromosome partitioning protein, partial [Micromonospora echinofusca]